MAKFGFHISRVDFIFFFSFFFFFFFERFRVVVVDLRPGKQLRSCRDGQLT